MRFIDRATSPKKTYARRALGLTRVFPVLALALVVNFTLFTPALADDTYGSGTYGQGAYQTGTSSSSDNASVMPSATNGAASPENSPQSAASPSQSTPTQGVSVQPSPTQPQVNTPTNVHQGNSISTIWILGGVLLLLVVAIGLILLRLKRRPPET